MHGGDWRRLFAVAFVALLPGLGGSPVHAQTYSSDCSGCHGPTPLGSGRVNAAGAVSVINVANTVNGMGTNAANWGAVAANIASLVPTSQTTSVAYGSSGNSIAIANILVAGSSVLSTLQQVSGPAVSISPGSNSVSYNHTAGTCNPQTIVVVGTGPPRAATGGTVTPITSNRTVTVNITAPPAPTASGSTSNIAYSTSPIAIPLTLGGGPASGVTITSALNPAVGTLSVAGTSVTYTASSTQFAPVLTFSYRADGPTGCGTASGTATVTINVSPPPAPSAAGKSVTVQSNTSTPIDLTSSVGGISTDVSVATPPSHGSATVAGYVVTYTPAANYSGPDSFTYVANGPGGSSTPATVNVTVSAAPLVANRSATVAYQTATPIDLTTSITGAFTSVQVASGPGHGTTSVSGAVVTYTPAAGYSGPDSFTYTATGSGGTSTPATVSITVNPPAPTVSNRSVSAASFATTSIDLATSISGSSTSIAIGSGPSHGVAVVTGATTVNYTPASGYIGPDSFTFTATGVGGTSAPATVSITVVPPGPPVANAATYAVPFNTAALLNLGGAITGVVSTVSIAGPPSHGTVSVITGTVVKYTPAPGFFGADTFKYVAEGPGGNSAPATITINVGVPGAPVAAAKAVTTAFNTPITIDLSSAISGVFTGIAIAGPPSHGTATLNGNFVTYAPASGFAGVDSFAFVATGPGGTSDPATITVTVTTQPPIATATTLAVALNTSATVDLAPFISGSAVTGVAISTAPAHGSVAVNGTRVSYTPVTNYFGTDSFAYVAFGIAGTSPPATVTVTVIGRPDPTKDPNVSAIIGAQAASAGRFARAQIGNFQQRLESLRGRGAEGEGPSAANRVPDRAAEAGARRTGNAPPQIASAGGSGLTGPIPSATGALSAALTNSFLSLATSQSLSLAADGSPGLPDGASLWIAGNLAFGHRDPVDGSQRLGFTTDGVSAGIDKRFGDRLALGFGVGFARDKTDIGGDGSKSRADGTAVASYGSYYPTPGTFIDGLLGYGSLDFDAERFVPVAGDFARSSRKGDQWFASLAAGYEHRHESLLISPYARLDYASTRLKRASETGVGLNALAYFEQTIPMFQGSLGVRAESQHDTRFGSVRPRARIELTRDFENGREAIVSYADEFGTRYAVAPSGVKRNALLLGIGSDFNLGGGLKLGLDYQVRSSSRADLEQGVRLQLTQDLDGRGAARWFAPSITFDDPVRVDASYTWDDNLTRARDARDKLADHVFGVNATKGHAFPLTTHARVVASVFAGAEDLYKYTGLGRVTGGFQAEWQYRPSSDFDAVTYGVLGRVSGDYYDTPIRRGFRYSVALTARKSLTDRIEAFAALTGSQRFGKSAVFDQRDYGAKFNLDYSLGRNGSLYLAGEYRRGDTVSSGRFALENIDIAEVFTPDEAFGPGFFAYRFDARTWLGTLGYNRPLGARDALDISWRRVQSTPVERPTFYVPGPFRYIDNQYSIVYLMRF